MKSVSEVEKFLKKEEIPYNDDEEVGLEEFTGIEAEFKDDDIFANDEEEDDATTSEVTRDITSWSHELEEGPPKLTEEELEAVDRQSRKTEIERLTEMKVLKSISRKQAEEGNYKHLSTKIVYDWRHRDGQWKRRGRLVAREFKWLTDYDLSALFSPTGVASTVKLLSALFVSTDNYCLGSIDIEDAHLQVEQDEPTIVEVDGKYYELGYTLPSQRTGSSAWFNKLQGIVEKYGLKSDDGLPAFFYKLPSESEAGTIMLSHVDDLEVLTTRDGFEDIVAKMKSEGLKLKVEGPISKEAGKSIGFLKRTFTLTEEGMEISMNSKYVESLEEALEIQQAFPKKLPVPADGGRAINAKPGADKPLTPEEHHLYRKGVGILLYLAPERPDLMFALKKLSMKLASPTEGDLELLRFVAKYLKGCPEIHLLHKTSYPGCSFQEQRNRSHEKQGARSVFAERSLIEICSDSDWAADRETRQSVSCGAIFVNGNMIHFQSKRQRSISLSSCESETIAAVSIMSEGIFIQKLLGRITGIEPEVRLYIDSSSSRQLISRKGLGKARHLDVNLVWIQKMKNVIVKPIKGTENPADLGTKALSRDKIKKYMKTLGYKGDFIDEVDQQVRKVKQTTTISVGMIAKIVTILMAEGFQVEAVKLDTKHSTPCMSGLFLVVLLLIVVFGALFTRSTSAAALAREAGVGKKKVEEKRRKEEKKMAEEKTIEEREAELHKMAAENVQARLTLTSLDKELEARKAEEEEKEKAKEATEEKEEVPSGSQPSKVSKSSSSTSSSDSSTEPEKKKEKPKKPRKKRRKCQVVPLI